MSEMGDIYLPMMTGYSNVSLQWQDVDYDSGYYLVYKEDDEYKDQLCMASKYPKLGTRV